MPPKTYAIIHDGTNLLVGTGGNSGRKSLPRRGNHLPGGTISNGNTPEVQIAEEIKEETGFALAQKCVPFKVEGLENVTFFVIEVPSVRDLVRGFERPVVTSPYDEPFAMVSAVPIVTARQSGFFNLDDSTDWFGKGLEHAAEHHLLG